jgi:hypothetical protein
MEPLDSSLFDQFAPANVSIFDQFLEQNKPAVSVFDQFTEQKIASAAPTLSDKLRSQLSKAKAHAEVTRQNYTASRLPQGLRLGYN